MSKEQRNDGQHEQESITPVEKRRRLKLLPTKKEAVEIARREHRFVMARDNKVYDWRSDEEVAAEHQRTLRSYQLIDALKAISTMPITPADYLAEIPDYLDQAIDEVFEEAVTWFDEFAVLWKFHNQEKKMASNNQRGTQAD